MAERLILALMVVCTAAVVPVTKGDCGKPPQLENGSPTDESISQTTFPVGANVFYRCYPGYIFQEGGSRRITCQANSTWSPLRATCEPINCGNPGEILNGYYNASDTTFGKKAFFYCDEGYQMVGRNFRLCTAEGWDGQVPTCDAINCPDPPPISNGTVSSLPEGAFWTFGMIASYSCGSGYSLIGEEHIACTATGKWDNDPPTCKVVQCHRPEPLKNGQIVAGFGPTYSYRETITYKCNADYKMVGKDVIECGENSTFVPQPPTCELRVCGKPPQLENGSPTDESISQTTFPVGANVTYRCYPGYVFQEGGSRRITCQANSTWSPLRATCELVQCHRPEPLKNGQIVAGFGPTYSYRETITYKCNADYKMVGKDVIECGENSTFVPQPPTCELRVCGKPPQLENGSPTDESISQTTFPVGANVTYRCYPGYVFQEGGSRRITCQANSTWSPLRATCEPINCGNPGEILNGYYNASDTTFGKKAFFYCDEGYQMVGRNFRLCAAEGWDGQVPTCDLIKCPDPPPISNGTVSSLPEGEFWTFGMIASYSCGSGYSLIGEEHIACTATGKWDNDPPTCKVVQCHRPEPLKNGQIVAGFGPTYSYRETITYKCNADYKMVGKDVIECGENSTFVPQPPTCELRVCGKPPQLENGSPTDESISQTTFPVGANVTYRCYPGYVFQEGGSRRITCQANSTWSPLRATCEPINCGNPGEILNGYYNASDTTFGKKAFFYCDEGYQMVGRNFRLCTAEGWDGQVPTCDPINCPDPPPISNGTVSSLPEGEFWTFGMIASYSCGSGYSLIGEEHIACTATGKWDNDPPTCKVVQCHRPEPLKNGQIVAGFGPTYSYRETITYKCNADYKMVGKDVIQCGENSTFVPQPPTCELRVCGKPPQLENGSPTDESISQTTFPVGANVTYRCHKGYIFQEGGSRHITCQANSVWSPLRATCELTATTTTAGGLGTGKIVEIVLGVVAALIAFIALIVLAAWLYKNKTKGSTI